MVSNKEREVLKQVLDMYKDMPFLWQKEHHHYLHKKKRREGYLALCDIYKQFDADATPQRVKKKIDNLRTNYVKELKKMISSKKIGPGIDEHIYQPTLWYFDALSFLRNRYESVRVERVEESEFLEDEEASYADEEQSSISSINSLYKNKNHDTLIIKKEITQATPANYRPKFSVRTTPEISRTTITEAATPEKTITQNNEKLEIYGKHVGYQMKDLDEEQLTIAQKLISDVIFYAKFKRLSEQSHIVAL